MSSHRSGLVQEGVLTTPDQRFDNNELHWTEKARDENTWSLLVWWRSV